MQKPRKGNPVLIEPVKYWWREWYTKVIEDTGRIIHWGPWNTRWVAQKVADLLTHNYRRYE